MGHVQPNAQRVVSQANFIIKIIAGSEMIFAKGLFKSVDAFKNIIIKTLSPTV